MKHPERPGNISPAAKRILAVGALAAAGIWGGAKLAETPQGPTAPEVPASILTVTTAQMESQSPKYEVTIQQGGTASDVAVVFAEAEGLHLDVANTQEGVTADSHAISKSLTGDPYGQGIMPGMKLVVSPDRPLEHPEALGQNPHVSVSQI